MASTFPIRRVSVRLSARLLRLGRESEPRWAYSFRPWSRLETTFCSGSTLALTRRGYPFSHEGDDVAVMREEELDLICSVVLKPVAA